MTLKTDMATDLTNVFFNADEFSESATYTASGSAAATITIGFEEENLAMQNPQPPGDSMVILVKYSDATSLGRGDSFSINSVTWYLDEIVSGGRAEGIWHVRVTRSARRDLTGRLS